MTAFLPAVTRLQSLPRVVATALISVCVGCAPGPAEWIVGLKSQDPSVRRAAAERLSDDSATTPEVLAALSAALEDADPEVRRWACRALGRHNASETVPKLEARLQDPAKAVRRASAFSLQRLAPESTGYRKEFLAGMREGDGGLLVTVKSFEPPPGWAIPALLDLVKDRRPGIRRLAIEALAEIAPAMDASRKAFEAARRDSDDRVREAAAKALERTR